MPRVRAAGAAAVLSLQCFVRGVPYCMQEASSGRGAAGIRTSCGAVDSPHNSELAFRLVEGERSRALISGYSRLLCVLVRLTLMEILWGSCGSRRDGIVAHWRSCWRVWASRSLAQCVRGSALSGFRSLVFLGQVGRLCGMPALARLLAAAFELRFGS